MHVDIGNFRAWATTTAIGSGQRFNGTWHVSMILGDDSTKVFEEGLVNSNFATEAEALAAAMEVATERARHLHERNSVKTYSDFH